MKRYAIFCFSAIVAVALAACGGKQSASADADDEDEDTPALTAIDSLSYAAGANLAGQFTQYGMLEQLGVDSTQVADFCHAVKSVVDMQGDKAKEARLTGMQLGTQIVQQIIPQNSSYYLGSNNAIEQISNSEVIRAFIKTMEGDAPMPVSEAHDFLNSFARGNNVTQLSRALGVALADLFGQADRMEQMNVDDDNLSAFLDGVDQAAQDFDGDAQKKARLMGLVIGNQLMSTIPDDEQRLFGADSLHLSKEYYVDGFVCVIAGEDGLMSAEGASTYMQNYITSRQKAKSVDDDFLKQNGRNPGVVTTESGLQYVVVRQGNGPKPTTSDVVSVHYEGRLTDGTVFDSSYERGEPAQFGVTQVIPGWTEALQLMNVGSEWVIYVPSYLGYGDRDLGSIPPSSTLIFKVELLDIVK